MSVWYRPILSEEAMYRTQEAAIAHAKSLSDSDGGQRHVYRQDPKLDISEERGEFVILDSEDGPINFPGQVPVFSTDGD